MSKEPDTSSPASGENEADRILALTVAANQMVANTLGTNPYEVRNMVLENKRVRAMLYKNGRTKVEVTAAALQAEARMKNARHSRKLGGNMRRNAPDNPRPQPTDAHHIVAATDSGASASRKILFSVLIGINDADNGVFLPRYKNTVIASLPNAHKHQGGLHTDIYHLTVYDVLSAVEQIQPRIRGRLRDIRERLKDGTFPY